MTIDVRRERRSALIKMTSFIGVWLTLRVLAWTVGFDTFQLTDAGLLIAFVLSVIWLAFDVVWLDSHLAKREQREETQSILNNPIDLGPRSGYVYLLQGQKGYYKVGHTKDPNDRYQTFKLNLPFEVEYLHLIICADRYAAESLLHRCFAHRRIKGTEWFQLTGDDIRLIKAIERL
jgi:hypothetical protein